MLDRVGGDPVVDAYSRILTKDVLRHYGIIKSGISTVPGERRISVQTRPAASKKKVSINPTETITEDVKQELPQPQKKKIYQVKFERYMEELKQKQQAAVEVKPFHARPVDHALLRPRLDSVLSENDKRLLQRRKSLLTTSASTSHSVHSPTRILDSAPAYLWQEEELQHKFKPKPLPPIYQTSSASKAKQRTPWTDPECTFAPKINKSVPDFKRLHQQAPQAKPLHRHSTDSKHKDDQSPAQKKKVCFPKYRDTKTSMTRSKLSQQQREHDTHRQQEVQIQEEHARQRQEEIGERLKAYIETHSIRVPSSIHKPRSDIHQQVQIAQEYRQRLEKMQERLKQRPLLVERAAVTVARSKADAALDDILSKHGLKSHFHNTQ